jgi:hypothetical protein
LQDWRRAEIEIVPMWIGTIVFFLRHAPAVPHIFRGELPGTITSCQSPCRRRSLNPMSRLADQNWGARMQSLNREGERFVIFFFVSADRERKNRDWNCRDR